MRRNGKIGLGKQQNQVITARGERCQRGAVVVYRRRKRQVEFLLVSRNSNPDQFVLPGGRTDPGESLRKAAQRECLEESGVEARIEGTLMEFDHFNSRGGVKPTRVYLARARREMPSPEGRDVLWVRYADLQGCVYDVPNPTLEVLDWAAQCLDADRVAA